MKATKKYVSDTLGLCFWWCFFVWDLYFVYSCMEALFTGEIGFGRTHSIIDIEKRPGLFWFAFWFQLILGITALPKILKQISNLKKLDVAREVNANPNDKVFFVEVTQINSHGIFLNIRGKEFYLSNERFPWLKNQSFQAISNVVEVSPDHYRWPEINVDLTFEMIKHY